MNRLIARVKRDEGGAALVLTLAFLAFIGAITPALLNYTTTNLNATVHLRELRGELYAADGVAELAIAKIRHSRSDRNLTPYCLNGSTVPLNGKALNVKCGGTDNDVTFTVCANTCATTADNRLIATVHYDDATPSSPTTVTGWSVQK